MGTKFWFALCASIAIAACGGSSDGRTSGGSTTGSPTSTSGSSGGTTAGNNCTNACPSAGATQCSNQQVQTCATGANGCLAWGAATACPSGQTCDGTKNACADMCMTAAVQSACGSAAMQFNQCCSGGGQTFTATQICQLIKQAGQDPQAVCSSEATASCSTLHQQLLAGTPACCCPQGQYCDLSTSTWTCTSLCNTSADCASQAGRTACAPDSNTQGVIGVKAMICKPDDGQLYDGCNTTSCSGNGCCFADAQGNEFCSIACAGSDAQCGSSGIACCNLTDASHTTCSAPGCGLCP